MADPRLQISCCLQERHKIGFTNPVFIEVPALADSLLFASGSVEKIAVA
jgi:hypothetical protein